MELTEQQKEAIGKSTFTNHNHMDLETLEPDYVVFRLDIRPESMNPYGTVHGGALYTLADDAAGVAVHTDGRSYVTQAGSLSFLENQSSGTVRAAGRVLRRGRSTAFVDVKITGEHGRLLASGSFIFHVIEKPVSDC